MSSDGSYPKDEGSSQEVTQSLFVGESLNRGTNGGQNKYWGPGGADAKMRTLPRNRCGGTSNRFSKELQGVIFEEARKSMLGKASTEEQLKGLTCLQ